jgi:inner membrane protein
MEYAKEGSAPAPASRSRFSSPLIRLLLIGGLIVLFGVPMSMLGHLVDERQARRDAAVADIESAWGGRQSLTGPILRVPFVTRQTRTDANGKPVEQTSADAAYLLPQTLHANALIRVQVRHRGIFQVPVYDASLHLQGQFERPDFASWGVLPEDIDWKHAELLLGLTGPRALHGDAALDWNGHVLRPKPSISQALELDAAGVHVPLGEDLAQVFESGTAAFGVTLGFNGTGSFYMAPTAEDTELEMKSDWPDPSFQGDWLPVRREVSASGFNANWSVSYLGRDYPQRWRQSVGMPRKLFASQFGVSLAAAVDPYSMAQRVTKYAALTLLLTFGVVWLTEVLSGQRVHAVQYGFVGMALCLFGLLQLSFAEHFGFTPAFAAASAAVVLMVTLYSYSMLRNRRRALVIGTVLGGLYTYLYSVIRAEDYALLGGSIALFGGLAAAMYLTRRIDWFALGSAAP